MKRRSALKSMLGLGAAAVVAACCTVPAVAADASIGFKQSTATLVIHKTEKTPKNGTTPGNGTTATVDGAGIDGVKFQIEKVKEVNLATNEGWEKAQNIVKANPNADGLPAGYTFGTAIADTTHSGGIVRFVNQPLGLYRVTEVSGPDNVQLAAPFWVTLPTADPVNKGDWLYEVHAYPKNTKHTLEKTVSDADTVAAGGELTWSISSPTSTQRPTSLAIEDTLDSKVSFLKAKVFIGGVELANTTDYKLSHENGKVTMTMTSAGLDKTVKAAADRPLDKLTLVVTAVVKQSGEINNVATKIVNDGKVRVKSNETVSKYGAIKVNKTDKETGKGIDGVEFEVWAAKGSNDFKQAKKVTVNGKDKFVTANGGKLEIDGLRYSGFADGAEVTDGDPKYLHYFLVETKPADGYNPLVEPVHFIVDQPLATAKTLDVKNTKPPALPLTGSTGVAALLISGLIVLSGAAVYFTRRVKRSEV